jgi:Pyridoxamine 5'-phosphate oxidase
MVEGEELEAIARRVIDSNQFITIGTADEEGVPWVSPAWYARAGYGEFFWVSVRTRDTRPTSPPGRLVALEYPPANAANR